MQLSTARITVHTRHPFRIARPGASVDGCDVHRVIVRLEHQGLCGYGEAAPTPYYNESLDSVEEVVQRVQLEGLLGGDPRDIEGIVTRLLSAFDDGRAAVSAIDAALHDWNGRRDSTPVWRQLGLDPSRTPPTSFTIGLGDAGTIERRVREAKPFDILKIKVGTDRDEEILEAVRRAVPTKTIRVDANASWRPDEALAKIEAFARFNLELVEQPIPAALHEDLTRLNKRSPIPIFVDEDSVCSEDLPRLAGCVAGVNVKLAKCGGILEALRMIRLARELGLKVMLGCMVETSLGVSAAAQIASLADFVDLDGSLLLADDPFHAVRIDGSIVRPADGVGLGANAGCFFEESS